LLIRHSKSKYIRTDCFFGDFAHWEMYFQTELYNSGRFIILDSQGKSDQAERIAFT